MTADVFSALANPVRRRLLDALLDGPRAAGDLAGRFDLSRPAVSEHLQVLRQVGLVREEPRGRQRYYHLDPQPLAEVGRWLHPFEHYWRGRLDALGALLDADPDGGGANAEDANADDAEAEADDATRPADSPDPDGSR